MTVLSRGDMRSVNEVDAQRYYTTPPFFVIAMESNVSIPTLLERLTQAPNVLAASGAGPLLSPIDGVFILGSGSALEFVGGSSLSLSDNNGGLVSGWAFLENDSALVTMLSWLNFAMPRIQRFSSIALQYLRQQSSTVHRPGVEASQST